MIEKVAVQINWNRWYFDEENDYGKVSEGFSDQKNQFKTLQSYLKDILSEDWIKRNRIWNYLSDRTKGDNSSLTFSLSQDYFIKAISKKDHPKQISFKTEIKISDLRKSDDEIRSEKKFPLD